MKTLMMIQALNTYQQQIVEAQTERDNQLAQIKEIEKQSKLVQSIDVTNAKINYEGIFRTIDTIHYKLSSARIPIPPDPQPTPILMADVPKKLQLWRNEVTAKLQDIEDLMNNSGQGVSSTDFGFDKGKQAGRLRVSIGLPALLVIANFFLPIGDIFLLNPITFFAIDIFERSGIRPDDIFPIFMVICILMAVIRPFVSGFLSAMARLVYFLISLNFLFTSVLITLSILSSSGSSRSRRSSSLFEIDLTPPPSATVFFIAATLIFLVMTWISLQNKLPYPSES